MDTSPETSNYVPAAVRELDGDANALQKAAKHCPRLKR